MTPHTSNSDKIEPNITSTMKTVLSPGNIVSEEYVDKMRVCMRVCVCACVRAYIHTYTHYLPVVGSVNTYMY